MGHSRPLFSLFSSFYCFKPLSLHPSLLFSFVFFIVSSILYSYFWVLLSFFFPSFSFFKDLYLLVVVFCVLVSPYYLSCSSMFVYFLIMFWVSFQHLTFYLHWLLSVHPFSIFFLSLSPSFSLFLYLLLDMGVRAALSSSMFYFNPFFLDLIPNRMTPHIPD